MITPKMHFVAIFFLAVFFFRGMEAGAATINAPSCSYADVSAAVTSASAGDTVIVPAGSGTWNSTLTIAKRVTLQGSGVGKTVIVAGTSGMSMINVNLSTDSPTILRITGFSFNMAGLASYGISLNNGTTNKVHNVRLDHNRFYNNNGRMIQGKGPIWGVVDNNTFDNVGFKVADFYGNNTNADWSTFQNDRKFGTVDNIYFEDNVVNSNNSVTSTGQGGRYCLRFNTYDTSQFTLSGMFPLWDQHGNQWDNYGNLMVEIYKNSITAGTKGGYLADQRGGYGLIWGNEVTSTVSLSSVKVRDEFDDVAYPPATAPNPYIMRVANSYYWLNRKNTSIKLGAFIDQQSDDSCGQYCNQNYGGCNSGYCLQPNANFWDENTSFNGTSGVGAGLLSARPATCTAGVGYWATDQGNWNKSGSGGQGVLYKCTSTNTWTLYYTPYTYPHPLRSGDTALPPCTDDCQSTDRQCSGAASYQACGNHDSDLCLDWGSAIACPSGQTCQNGSCQAATGQSFLPNQTIEAEQGVLSAPMQASPDSLASGGQYVYSAINDQGAVNFSFNIPTAGKYKLEAKVNANNNSGQNSFYVGLDNEAASGNNYFAYQSAVTAGYAWDEINRVGNGTALPEFDPIVFDLAAGTHTFTFYGREANTRLDQIILKPYAQTKKGDLNADNKVDVTDLGLLLGNWNNAACNVPCRGDLNQDGKVDVTDLGVLLGNWG